ncbi:integrase catalytic domain-containing protein [Trichonephila clavipes]|nr:integrase catalytic domain-containing protein [Trichonephila clavipes]
MFNLVCKPDEALASYMASEGIDWKFLPPRAPNFGGLWEAGVKSFKFYLKRVVGNIRLTYEEFLTVIIQIEGMLNSRPLVPLSSDLDDLNVLTPSHFLIGRSITSIVEPDLTNLNENRRILEIKLINSFPPKIIWPYGIYPKLFDKMSDIEFHEGMPFDVEDITNAFVIIDDLMNEVGDDKRTFKLVHERKPS